MFKEFFNDNLKIAYGCTEPVAVAWACSHIGKLLKSDKLESLKIILDRNIFKNGFGAGIPNSGNRTGNLLAGAIGYFIADPDRNFSIFSDYDKSILEKAQDIVEKKIVEIKVDNEVSGIYINVCGQTVNGDSASAEIRNDHLGLVRLTHNGETVFEDDVRKEMSSADNSFLLEMTVDDLIQTVGRLDDSELEITETACSANLNAAEYGLENPSGIRLGVTLKKLWENEEICHSVENYIKMYTAAACDARMGGESVPVMTLCGSGNQGIAATIPIVCYYNFHKMTDRKRLRQSLALSWLITAYIKKRLGKLSPICGCVVASGSGATAGIAYLRKYSSQTIKDAISNLIGDVTGVICDGAKGSCTLKLATAVASAPYYALIAENNCTVNEYNGIIGRSIEETVENLRKVANNGMSMVDNEIVDIFREKLKK